MSPREVLPYMVASSLWCWDEGRQKTALTTQGLIMVYCEYPSLNLRVSLHIKKKNQVEQLNTKS